MANTEGPKNTKRQLEFIKAQDDAWQEERTWPLWQIELSGDEVPYVPRADTRYWRLEDPDDPNSGWIPKDEGDLPKDASLDDDGQVVRVAHAVVTCRAKSEELAKMFALRDNTDYHTVESVKKVSKQS